MEQFSVYFEREFKVPLVVGLLIEEYIHEIIVLYQVEPTFSNHFSNPFFYSSTKLFHRNGEFLYFARLIPCEPKMNFEMVPTSKYSFRYYTTEVRPHVTDTFTDFAAILFKNILLERFFDTSLERAGVFATKNLSSYKLYLDGIQELLRARCYLLSADKAFSFYVEPLTRRLNNCCA